jgi:hypothetical protein
MSISAGSLASLSRLELPVNNFEVVSESAAHVEKEALASLTALRGFSSNKSTKPYLDVGTRLG